MESSDKTCADQGYGKYLFLLGIGLMFILWVAPPLVLLEPAQTVLLIALVLHALAACLLGLGAVDTGVILFEANADEHGVFAGVIATAQLLGAMWALGIAVGVLTPAETSLPQPMGSLEGTLGLVMLMISGLVLMLMLGAIGSRNMLDASPFHVAAVFFMGLGWFVLGIETWVTDLTELGFIAVFIGSGTIFGGVVGVARWFSADGRAERRYRETSAECAAHVVRGDTEQAMSIVKGLKDPKLVKSILNVMARGVAEQASPDEGLAGEAVRVRSAIIDLHTSFAPQGSQVAHREELIMMLFDRAWVNKGSGCLRAAYLDFVEASRLIEVQQKETGALFDPTVRFVVLHGIHASLQDLGFMMGASIELEAGVKELRRDLMAESARGHSSRETVDLLDKLNQLYERFQAREEGRPVAPGGSEAADGGAN